VIKATAGSAKKIAKKSNDGSNCAAGTTNATGYVSEQDRFATLIKSGNTFLMLGGFFLAGLVLAFTPCVLPMVPILSGIIAGQGKNVTTGRAFALSLTYVLGMAFTYTIAGALCAAAGKQVQTVFQQPWILALFAALFIALALSMFGLFTIQMPAAIQTRVADVSNKQAAGTFGGVARPRPIRSPKPMIILRQGNDVVVPGVAANVVELFLEIRIATHQAVK